MFDRVRSFVRLFGWSLGRSFGPICAQGSPKSPDADVNVDVPTIGGEAGSPSIDLPAVPSAGVAGEVAGVDFTGTLPYSAAELSAGGDEAVDMPGGVSVPEADVSGGGVDLPGPLPSAGDGIGFSGSGEW